MKHLSEEELIEHYYKETTCSAGLQTSCRVGVLAHTSVGPRGSVMPVGNDKETSVDQEVHATAGQEVAATISSPAARQTSQGDYQADAGIEKHLARCAACAQAFAALRSDLAAIAFPAPPARDAAYGERVWAAISTSLPRLEARPHRWLRMSLLQGLSYATAFALLLACTFYAGRQWEHHQPRITVAQTPPPSRPAARPPERVVVVVLSDHLDRSERLLVELKHADADSAELISPMRDEARNLLAANRLYRKEAKKQDDPALAEALDRLDQLFDELANQPGGLNAAAITRLQNQLNSDSLLFEVRVLRSRAMDQKPVANPRPHGGTI